MSVQPISEELTKVTVIGAGAWGTALAIHCARKGHDTMLWAMEPHAVEEINTKHTNETFLKNVPLPESLKATGDIKEAVERAEMILTVIPTPFLFKSMSGIKEYLREDQYIVSCTKGILNDTLETPDGIIRRALPENLCKRLAFLSGPSFAAEVGRDFPTAVTIAAEDPAVAQRVQQLMSTNRFRCYRTTDVVGVELAGALKNVLAIACGISDGCGFGNNGRAALITRGLDEITRIAVASGANPLTLAGLAGVGDIVLTCCGDLSRNRTVGLRLGKGEKLDHIVKTLGATAEGVLTSRAAYDLTKKLGIDCAVIHGIYRVVNEEAEPMKVVAETMARPLRAEVAESVAEAAVTNARNLAE